jgi:hypothetical protein
MTQQQRRAVFGFHERKKGKKAREEGGLEGVPRAQGLGGCLGRRLLHLRNTGQRMPRGLERKCSVVCLAVVFIPQKKPIVYPLVEKATIVSF